MAERGVCSFKSKCHHCNITNEHERPQACVTLACPYYTPCLNCGNNRILTAGICKDCETQPTTKAKDKPAPKSTPEELAMTKGVSTSGEPKKAYSITVPGTPPEELNEQEVKYYMARWEDYKGFYRSPAAYAVCHNIIIEEINLSYQQSRTIDLRGERQALAEKAKATSMLLLAQLHKLLPEKEANDETDDDKAMSVIYEAYCKEKELMTRKDVSRRITQEAIALAPALIYKVDIKSLLQRCGFRLIDIEEAIKRRGVNWDDVPAELDDILEWLGFKHRQEYAMDFRPPDEPLLMDERLELEDG